MRGSPEPLIALLSKNSSKSASPIAFLLSSRIFRQCTLDAIVVQGHGDTSNSF